MSLFFRLKIFELDLNMKRKTNYLDGFCNLCTSLLLKKPPSFLNNKNKRNTNEFIKGNNPYDI